MNRRELLVAIPATALTACFGGGEAVRIGYQRNGVLFVARARGGTEAALRRAGVRRLDWSVFNAGPPLLEALSAGAVDFGATGDAPPILAQAAGAELVYVAAVPLSGRAGAVLVAKNSPLRSLVDLKGRRVAFTRGSSAQVTVESLLRTAGLSLRDVTPVNLSPADGAPALARGDVDAWYVWDPYLATAEAAGGVRALASGAQGRPAYQFLLAGRRFAEERPEAVRALLDHLRAEGRWAVAHPAEVGALMANETGAAPAVMTRVAERQDYAVQPMTGAIVAAQQELADILAADGVAPGKVRVADVVWRAGWT